MTAKQKVEALTTAANEVTGESATNLTDAIQDLIDGYGGGGGDLPDSYILLSDYNEDGSPTKAEIKRVTKLLNYCFYHYDGLTEITIPNSVTYLGSNCFTNSGITSIVLPDGVTYVGDSCFQSCNDLTSIVLPDSVTYLGKSCFESCTSLTSIMIPESVTYLNSRCFWYCEGLVSITLKRTTMYQYPSNFFARVYSLQHIYVPANLVDSYKDQPGWNLYADKIEAIPTT